MADARPRLARSVAIIFGLAVAAGSAESRQTIDQAVAEPPGAGSAAAQERVARARHSRPERDEEEPRPGRRHRAEPDEPPPEHPARPHSEGATPPALEIPNAQLETVEWSDLDGWSADDHAAAFATFLVSCRPTVKIPQAALQQHKPVVGALYHVCRRAIAAAGRTARLDAEQARVFFEQNFRPMRIAKLGENAGFLTGYYEPIVEGSRVQTPEFSAPLYRRPANLIWSGLSQRPNADSFPNKGVKVGRLVGRRKLVPYYDRGQIENGALAGRNLEICWLKDANDVLVAQIQGSLRVKLADGTILRLTYDAHNGFPYTPIGRVLIDRGIIPREEMTMDRLRQWLAANPDQAKELRGKNQTYVFFRTTSLSAQEEAVGGEGVSLTGGRSIAIDRALHSYGTPFFIEADLPIAGNTPSTKFRRLMIAQDTGSAIVGPARADIYFGAGDDAGRVAGRVRQPGKFAMLIPRELDPVAAGAHVPLPPERPKVKEGEEVTTGKANERPEEADDDEEPRRAGHRRRHRQ
jgi:membrane-bound lytic murein transglycosylase A